MPIRVPAVQSGIAGLLLIAALCLAYLPDLGHGFVKDDFMWIRSARIQSADHAVGLFSQNVGFYRPVVAATFAMNYALSGMNPLAYGLTNFALLALGAGLLYLLARRIGLPPAASALACGVWVFSFHGINMAVLWISARTALLLSCAALASTLFVLSDRMILAGVLCLLAMLSKEEAVVLPFLLAAWMYLVSSGTRTAVARRVISTWPLFAALAVYVVLRLESGAFWLAAAPSYYRLTIQPQVLLRNVLEYLDRGATWPAVVALMVMAAARALPVFTAEERRIIALGALWFVFGYAITVFVPVRSSLYAVFPSIGACLAAAVVVAALLRSHPARARAALAALTVVPLLLVPVFRSRNVGSVGPADLSATVLNDLRRATAPVSGARIVLVDDPLARFNLAAAFGALFPDAVTLVLGDQFRGEVLYTGGDVAHANLDGALVLALRNGHLEPYR